MVPDADPASGEAQRTLTIPEALDGERVDRVVAMLADLSRSAVATLIGAGQVRRNGRNVTARSDRVEVGDELWFDASMLTVESIPLPDPSVAFAVLHEDDDLLIIDKPAGLVVHPGAGNPDGTLVNGLLARYPGIATVGSPERPGIVHRLDKGTSGVLAVARTDVAYDGLVGLLANHEVERIYDTIVWGDVGAPDGVIDAAIGRSQRDPTRMAVTARGKHARTHYRVDRKAHTPAMSKLTCRLETGRTHQIRVHLTSIGHPVVGDTRYRGANPEGVALTRPWLHARELRFVHPVTGKELSVVSEWPDDLVKVHDYFF